MSVDPVERHLREQYVFVNGERSNIEALEALSTLRSQLEEARAERDAARHSADTVHKAASDNAARASAAESRINQLEQVLREIAASHPGTGLATVRGEHCVDLVRLAAAALGENPPTERRMTQSASNTIWPGTPDSRCPTCGSTDKAHRYLTVRMPHSEKRCPDPWHTISPTEERENR